MSKKIGKKIWIYVGVGVFLVIVGIISWGVATDWKFIGDSKKSGGGGPSPPPPPPSPSPSDKCDGKCKENETCCQSIKDGTTYKCCPNTISDPVFDGDKCCSRANIVDNKCCDNPSKQTITKSTSFFKDIYSKQCCDTKPYDKSDSNGCYELCGDNTTKCYQLKGEYCPDKPDSDDGKYQCVSNPKCQWESLPSPSPITDQSIDCRDSDCIVGFCDPINNKCNIQTVGLTDEENNFKSDKYRFTFMGNDYKPKNWKFERQMEVLENEENNQCNSKDCEIAFANHNSASPPVLKDGVCRAVQNLDKFNKNTKCPFTDTTRCCIKSGSNTEFTGQICEDGKVGAINKSIPTTSPGGYLSECVASGDCVDTNGEVCGGNGYCQYDSTLNDGEGGGKCICESPPEVDKKFCTATMPFHLYEYNIFTSKGEETPKATWRMIPFKTCGSNICTAKYFNDFPLADGQQNLQAYLEANLSDYEVINDYQIYQIIDNGLYDPNPRTGPNFPPRALTIAGASEHNKSNSWTSIVNDTGNLYKNDGFYTPRVYNSFLIYKKKNQSISDGIYIFAFGYFMFNVTFYGYDAPKPEQCWLNISSKYSKTSSTPTTFYFKKAKKCCEADNIDCNTYNYCQINGIQNSQYGIDSNNKGGTCSDFDENITLGGKEDGNACTPNNFGKFYRFINRCSLSNGQTKTENACVYRCTNQQSKYCFEANPGDNNGIDTCICQRSGLMTAKTTAKPFKWDFSNTDGSGVWKEVFLK